MPVSGLQCVMHLSNNSMFEFVKKVFFIRLYKQLVVYITPSLSTPILSRECPSLPLRGYLMITRLMEANSCEDDLSPRMDLMTMKMNVLLRMGGLTLCLPPHLPVFLSAHWSVWLHIDMVQ